MAYQDIQTTDIALRQQFATAWLNGQYAEALNILQNSGQLDTKAFVAEIALSMGQALSAIESYYYNEIISALDIKFNQFNAMINNFIQRNNWSATASYEVGNVVLYNEEIYLAIEDSVGVEPTNDTYWVYMGLRGEEGLGGLGINLRYQWTSTTNYVADDLVVYENYLWLSTQSQSGQVPTLESEYWIAFLEFPEAQILVSRQAPSTLYDGLIWFRILQAYTWAEVNELNYTFADINQGFTWEWINGGGW